MAKKLKIPAIIIALSCVLFVLGCKKELRTETDHNELIIVKSKLKELGFNLDIGFRSFRDGYLIENDIFLTKEQIFNFDSNSVVDINVPIEKQPNNHDRGGGANGKISHYSTNNMVVINYGTRRNINVYIDPSFSSYYNGCLDSAINRYNQVDIGLIFTKVNNISSADIKILPYSEDSSVLGYAGFPLGNNPYSFVHLNTKFFNNLSNRADGITVIAHEIGHCIGFRHTDAGNTAYSCGGSYSPESSSGMSHIPSTPISGSPGSWMLACSNYTDRPFTMDDIFALKIVYPYTKNIYVKEVLTYIDSDSWVSGYDDWDMVTWGVVAEFYQDSNLSVPYITSGNFVLNTNYGSEVVSNPKPIMIPNGVTSYNLGTFVRDRYFSYGILVQDNSTGHRVTGFRGYFGPSF